MKAEVAIAVLLLTLVACSPGRGEVPISEARADGETSSVLELGVSSCNGDPDAEVTETPDAITVTVTADLPGSNSDDCADGMTIPLSEPLGQRKVVDGATGQTLDIIDRP